MDVHVLQGEREMVADNQTLGRFELVGIPSAPRGVPQIEVSFDIDANGILNVAAKDLGTGKEQAIKITSKSNLSEDEINKMIKDAEVNADLDKKKRELVLARNNLDNIIYQVDKLLKDNKDGIGEETRKQANTAITDARNALASEDIDQIKEFTEKLTGINQNISSELYKSQGQSANKEASSAEGSNNTGSEAGSKTGENKGKNADDDVIDADFKDVN